MKHAFTHTHTHTPTETLHTCFITSHLYLPLCAELIVLLVTHKNSLWRTSEKQHSTTPQGARVMRAHSSASLVPVLTHVNTHTHTHTHTHTAQRLHTYTHHTHTHTHTHTHAHTHTHTHTHTHKHTAKGC